MRKKTLTYLICLIFAIAGVGCSDGLQKMIDESALDGNVTQREFSAIQAYVKRETKYGKIADQIVLARYLDKYFTAKKIKINIWDPNQKPLEKFDVNIFFENSYSMDGYMYQADLKSSVYDVLVNTKQFAKSISLNYINDTIIKIPSEDLKSYSLNLTPNRFKILGGSRGVSDIAKVIKDVLSHTNNKSASILVSDFIFSPPKHENAVSYLDIQQVTLKDAFRDKLQTENLVVSIFQMKATFQGVYYDYTSKKIWLPNVSRPYYIWFIGTKQQVQQALKFQLINKNNPLLLNTLILSKPKAPTQTAHLLVNKGKVGSYTFIKKDEISNAKSSDGVFSLGIAINFAEDIRGADYFSDQSLYRVSNPDYTIKIRKLTPVERGSSLSLAKHTHLLELSTKKLRKEILTVQILDKLPSWIDSYSSTDDRKIKVDPAEQRKTFGLKFLINGVAEGFTTAGAINILTELKINIK